ncbi:hypothetical protein C5B93_01125 [Rathayibacter sp. AY1A2]|nr:hypothetical protein C5B93_01125 [Rathayibacter sp. AY1A2]
MGPWTAGQTFVGSSQTCPVPGCNKRATILDARYVAGPSGQLHVTPSTELGEYQLARLRKSLEQTRRRVKKGDDPERVLADLERDIAREAPALASVIQQTKSSFWDKATGDRAVALYALISTIMAIISVFLGSAALQVAMDSRQDIIDQVVEEQLREAGIGGGETGTPSPAAPTPSEPPPPPESEPPVLEA